MVQSIDLQSPNVSFSVVVRQRLTNRTQIDMSTCPLDNGLAFYTCSARFVNLECEETARLTCSVVNTENNTTVAITMVLFDVDGEYCIHCTYSIQCSSSAFFFIMLNCSTKCTYDVNLMLMMTYVCFVWYIIIIISVSLIAKIKSMCTNSR
jgi:uncharacterized membrane protein